MMLAPDVLELSKFQFRRHAVFTGHFFTCHPLLGRSQEQKKIHREMASLCVNERNAALTPAKALSGETIAV